MKLIIPHIHKTLGDAGFFAEISKRGEIKELRVQVLEGLRQIEGILIGRRVFEAPLVVSRICGICPTSHILNACRALEKALDIKVSKQTEMLRRLITTAQMIQSHSLHIFYMSLADFFNIKDNVELSKKFSKESDAVLELRDFSLEIIKLTGGRAVHPMRPIVGGFTKIPEKAEIKKLIEGCKKAREKALILINLFKNLDYPALKRQTKFCCTFDDKEYVYHNGNIIKVDEEIFSLGDFFSNQIEEDLKETPSKKVEFRGGAYMLGAIARVKNNLKNLDKEAVKFLKEFQKKNKLEENELFENTFYNTFYQALEIFHFLNEAEFVLKELFSMKEEEPCVKYEVKKGNGLAALEAPRGVILSYFGVDDKGKISECSIITPTAQFLRNLEEDLRVLLVGSNNLSDKEKINQVKMLIRAYDPCISCAVH
jgi:coenzyme F420-reducing hydrogenase alpha subunit